MAVTADNTILVVCSRLNSAVYVYSLPDLRLLGAVDVGVAPDWVTLTPDGRLRLRGQRRVQLGVGGRPRSACVK